MAATGIAMLSMMRLILNKHRAWKLIGIILLLTHWDYVYVVL